MQIVIPMAGSGARFARAGYTTLKPLIPVDGMPMIEHVVRMFPGEQNFIFICARNHLAETPLQATLSQLVPTAKIIPVEPHKYGPVWTSLAAADAINDDEPVVINYCDAAVRWDYAHFKREMAALDWAGGLVAFKGFHPHSLGDTLYAYIREQDNRLLEIREKQAFTNDRMAEFASTGTYYFQSGALLKGFFQRLVDRNQHVNGEFYVSLVYNLLVEDGLEVGVYRADNFLHWGIPEDLAEYRQWSTYFAHYVDWSPNLPPQSGSNLIPMAGDGLRFRREGYLPPKPLIPVAGKAMAQRALDTFPPAKRWIAACRSEHLQTSALGAVLRSNGHQTQILPVAHPTEGQACTSLLARAYLEPTAPLLIAPCDAALVYNVQQYAALTANPEVDCLVWTFRNHAHANRNPKQYGWVQANLQGDIERVTCKVPLSDDVQHDPGIIGAFWFRQARFFLEAADSLIAQNRRVNNEFYVDSTVEVLLEQGRRAKLFDVDFYICFGTPDDVRSYEYWANYFHTTPHHSYQNGYLPYAPLHHTALL